MQRLSQLFLALVPATALACASTPAPAPPADAGLAPPPPPQQSHYGTYEGESELSVGASISSSTTKPEGGQDTDFSLLSLQLGYGYFVSDSFELGGQVTFSSSDSDGQEDPNLTLGLLPYVRWNFRVGDTSWLYVGAHAGVTTFQQDDGQPNTSADTETAFSLGGHAGWKLWITPETAFFIEPRFTTSTIEFDNGFGGTFDVDVDEFLTLIGFTVSL